MTRFPPRERGAAGEADGDRLDRLYRRWMPAALRLAYLLTADRVAAEDLAQDAFVKVMVRFRDLRNRDAFWWYLRRTIVNLSRSRLRRKRLERAYLDRERSAPAPPVPDLDTPHRIREALLELRPEQRAAIVLRYYEDLTEAETAEVLGWPVGTVKSTVSRAMQRLRRELADG